MKYKLYIIINNMNIYTDLPEFNIINNYIENYDEEVNNFIKNIKNIKDKKNENNNNINININNDNRHNITIKE
jgi:hypothetical protein